MAGIRGPYAIRDVAIARRDVAQRDRIKGDSARIP